MQAKLGGERLGSGKKMTVNLRNFNRSTHNLSETWLSSMAPGVLYPFYCNVGVNGDTFNIDLQAAARTIPTQGPMFGTFKLQLDMFAIPLRLYNGILHNNQVNIGLQMSKVLLPKVEITQRPIFIQSLEESKGETRPTTIQEEIEQYGINPSSLVRYLGYSGVGLVDADPRITDPSAEITPMKKTINACPFLAYYDIFKNYYANKQEKQAFVITKLFDDTTTRITKIETFTISAGGTATTLETGNSGDTYNFQLSTSTTSFGFEIHADGTYNQGEIVMSLYIEYLARVRDPESGMRNGRNDYSYEKKYKTQNFTIAQLLRTGELVENVITDPITGEVYYQYILDKWKNNETPLKFKLSTPQLKDLTVNLKPFDLENIDNYRKRCLKTIDLDQQLIFKNTQLTRPPKAELYPIKAVTNWEQDMINNTIAATNETPLNGLLVKTYQSDIFNNFLNTELITGENGINEITKINVSDGLSMDALILQKKVYDMLNRIAVKGNTYQDWQEAVYTQKATRMAEIPLWIGGMSEEIVFEEIIQTAPTEETPLGNLGGKGRLLGNQHGGHIKYKCDEPCLIMGIVSITPRLTYSQGNAWYMTEINSINDLHKPSLDGIGFQDLMAQQAAWFTNKWDSENEEWNDSMAIGKTPAWINYMTAFDKCFGDFALNQGKSYMVLNREYDCTFDEDGNYIGYLGTYIDPAKFNYAFAYSSLDAQNFWVQIRSTITARRLMSAKVIPNL